MPKFILALVVRSVLGLGASEPWLVTLNRKLYL